ncbi:hypothetical protein [Rhodohalobacter sulfatireducens]|uniref:Twin-arginine translocation signal domain-containing protein n=1 Tax=Rhodohalobacter sulfatireducens TaxID=2911366 RepID=A0ABS9K9R2_9BACT|nr:hypothetical protein [Rhodohalobacter sulfatireducens]MCG2587593.1 hypothetical protein [Rhodohalobacter sulfatireducens]
MADSKTTRRDFIKKSSLLAGGAIIPSIFHIGRSKPKLEDTILGHGDFQYRVHQEWGNLDPENTPVKNCHEMVLDSQGRLIMITDEVQNNIIIYDKSGKLLESWGDQFPGGHGLTLFDEGGEDVLFITDYSLEKVFKTTTDGRMLMTIGHPNTIGVYGEEDPFRPTETAIAPNGDIYVADGYGSQFILQYDSDGNFIRKFGGAGDEDHLFSTAHGVAIDDRSGTPTLLCTSRGHNSFKRFTMDGEYLETIFLPGAFVCRPVIDDGNIYSGVCWSRLRYLNQTDNSGFVTILNDQNRVVSNPGGTQPEYENGELQLMVQENPLFNHCHDVCVDEDKNLYVCQWNAGQTYPIKLERV